MTQLNWKKYGTCCVGVVRRGNETPELFGRSWCEGISPLFWRVPILVWAIIIISWSATSFWGPSGKFFLYMTHWGLLLIVLESFFGILVTVTKLDENPLDATFGLPWHVKTYWVLYNITIPVALLITVFYWGVLKTSGKIVNYAPNPVLDVMLHGVNSAVMLIELVSSAHPSRLLHIVQPLFFALTYVLFTIIYYYAGGQDPWGHHFIYPVIDWSKPEQTIVIVALTALFLALMHIFVVVVAAARDLIAKMCLKDSSGVYNEGFSA